MGTSVQKERINNLLPVKIIALKMREIDCGTWEIDRLDLFGAEESPKPSGQTIEREPDGTIVVRVGPWTWRIAAYSLKLKEGWDN
jgi:hypothetical protein